MGYIYLGESAGGRIIRSGVGYSQVGDAYQLEVRYWEQFPFGPQGDGVVREIVTKIRHTLGYSIRVTPMVDGRAIGSTSFGGGAPSGGLTEELVECRAPVFRRCNQIGAIVRTLSLLGETELVECGYEPIAIREVP